MNLLKPLKFLMRKFTPLFPQPAKNAVQAEDHKSRGGKGAGAIAFIFALISRKVNFIILVSRLDEFSGFSPHPKPLPRKEGGASRLDFSLPLFTGGAFGVGYWPGRPAVLRPQRTARVRGFPSLVGILVAILLVACQPLAQSTDIHVRVVADGKESVYTAKETTTVAQFLRQTDIQLDTLDTLNPPEFTQITDNMTITIVRVREQQVCRDEVVPYQTRFISSPDLAPGTQKVAQPGVNGSQRVCDDVITKDGVEAGRTAGNPSITVQPRDEIIARAIDKKNIEPIPIDGLIAYISAGEARVIESNSQNDRALPTGGGLDGFVFALSPDGKKLLFTRKPSDGTATPDTFNELWVLLDTSDPQATPVRIKELDNVLTADWKPDEPFTFSYSTLQPREQVPGYQALNDLNIARINSQTGKLLKATPVVKSRPTGVYGVWGTQFRWSPDGKSLAWAQADGAGTVDFGGSGREGSFKKLFNFQVYSTTLSNSWVWTPNLSWSPNSDLLAATIHGKPLDTESPETSPVFDVALVQANNKSQGLFQVDLVPQAGMWSGPEYSPLIDNGNGNKLGYIAYLKARSPIDSVSSEYDLVIADRDGSNAKPIFPGSDKPGLKPLDNLIGNLVSSEMAWSPSGQQIVLIYQGDLWIVDVASGRANQITLVNNAHHPRWAK